jgi:hypothetical protein
MNFNFLIRNILNSIFKIKHVEKKKVFICINRMNDKGMPVSHLQFRGRNIFTLLAMLSRTDPIKTTYNARIAKRLILPLAVLSMTFAWYCKIMVGLVKYLLALQIMLNISNPRRGNKSKFPVPIVFFLLSSIILIDQ